ncbi:MAG: biopolymer transporter ExbD [Verrucomicrobia bacterium]|nr:biopolymer transporter ExbD [Verrucomicrobiota bacterium]
MRFPRNTKVFRGQLDAAPYAGVLFLLVIFLVLNSKFIFIPGVEIHLPEASGLPGTEQRTLAVVVDREGRFYFENQLADQAQLTSRLHDAVRRANAPLTLVVQADETVTYHVLSRLWVIAQSAGVQTVLQATRPPLVPGSAPGRPEGAPR